MADRPDWVRARGACNIEFLFTELVREMQKDVEAANALRPPNSAAASLFALDPPPQSPQNLLHMGDSFSVTQAPRSHPGRIIRRVTVAMTSPSTMRVLDQGEGREKRWEDITAVWDTDAHRCILELNGKKDIALWEISRALLESLFFDPPPFPS